MSSNFGFLQELLTTVADTSRTLLPKRLFAEAEGQRGLQALVDALMSGQGEASGMAIANQLLRHYDEMDQELRLVFFRYIAQVLKPDAKTVTAAAAAYQAAPSEKALTALQDAVESPKQEFFRRLNMAPGATAKIVAMRKELLGFMRDDPSLGLVARGGRIVPERGRVHARPHRLHVRAQREALDPLVHQGPGLLCVHRGGPSHGRFAGLDELNPPLYFPHMGQILIHRTTVRSTQRGPQARHLSDYIVEHAPISPPPRCTILRRIACSEQPLEHSARLSNRRKWLVRRRP